jgi:cyanate permease
MLFSPVADHPFATGFWDTALLVLITLAFTSLFVWLWWRSRDVEPEMEEEEEIRRLGD